MSFISDLFGGTQEMPQQTIIPTDQLLNQTSGLLTSNIAPATIAYNRALATGLEGLYNQIDPSVMGNIKGSGQSILDQLNLGNQMDPALQAEITRGLLATNTATGFGASPGGVGGIFYQTAMDKQALLRQRQQDALGAATTGANILQGLYPTQLPFGAEPGFNLANDIRVTKAREDEKINVARNIELQKEGADYKALLTAAGTVIGGVAGYFSGNVAGGAIAGGQIGSQLYKGKSVYGQQQPQQASGGGGGGLFNGLSGMFKSGSPEIGGRQYGIGAGR